MTNVAKRSEEMVSTDKLEIHIGDKVKTPVGILLVDDLEDSDLRDAYIYLAGCGFTWNGTPAEFRKNKFKVVK